MFKKWDDIYSWFGYDCDESWITIGLIAAEVKGICDCVVKLLLLTNTSDFMLKVG